MGGDSLHPGHSDSSRDLWPLAGASGCLSKESVIRSSVCRQTEHAMRLPSSVQASCPKDTPAKGKHWQLTSSHRSRICPAHLHRLPVVGVKPSLQLDSFQVLRRSRGKIKNFALSSATRFPPPPPPPIFRVLFKGTRFEISTFDFPREKWLTYKSSPCHASMRLPLWAGHLLGDLR